MRVLILLFAGHLLLCSPDLYAQPEGQLIILQYHHIGEDTPFSTSTKLQDLRAHLQLIEQLGLPVVSLPQAIETIKTQGGLANTSVAITFDDAFISVYTHAFTLLKQRKWPFTVFVNPQNIGKSNLYNMSWQQLKSLKQYGATIANHGYSHAYLLNKPEHLSWSAWLTQEVTQAQNILTERLGINNKLFAYPYGELNVPIMRWLNRQGYVSFGQHSGVVSRYSNWQAIPRFPAGGTHADVKALKTKLQSLALPVPSKQWQEPSLSQANPPLLTLQIKSKDIRISQIQCYSNTEGAIPTFVTNTDGLIQIQTRAKGAIKIGRDRYNCTAPSKRVPKQFYWYSQLWINLQVMPR